MHSFKTLFVFFIAVASMSASHVQGSPRARRYPLRDFLDNAELSNEKRGQSNSGGASGSDISINKTTVRQYNCPNGFHCIFVTNKDMFENVDQASCTSDGLLCTFNLKSTVHIRCPRDGSEVTVQWDLVDDQNRSFSSMDATTLGAIVGAFQSQGYTEQVTQSAYDSAAFDCYYN